jgi:hypothetical protein
MSHDPEVGRYAIVIDTNVTNIVLWDGQCEVPSNLTMVEITDEMPPVGIGWKYDGSEWIEPPPLGDEDFSA